MPQLFLDVDRDKVKTATFRCSVFQHAPGLPGLGLRQRLQLFGRIYKVMIQADEPFRPSGPTSPARGPRQLSGRMIPLAPWSTSRTRSGPDDLTATTCIPSATITGEPRPGYSSGQAIAAMEELAGKLPAALDGLRVVRHDLPADRRRQPAPFIFALALVFVYLFLAAQYESWTLPLGVMLSVPLGGPRRDVLATGPRARQQHLHPDRLGAADRLSAKSAILIVEFANQLREEGKSPFEAAVEAARLRFRPILMTAFSFILGVMPLVIASGAGAASRVALGTAVFGGMAFATVFGVFFIPWLYFVVQSLSEKIGRC